jgi:hypothetical protein
MAGLAGKKLNPYFLQTLKHSVVSESLLLFLCRSGQRSAHAAKAATEAGYPDCYNILEGFEGNKDANGQRNRTAAGAMPACPGTRAEVNHANRHHLLRPLQQPRRQ